MTTEEHVQEITNKYLFYLRGQLNRNEINKDELIDQLRFKTLYNSLSQRYEVINDISYNAFYVFVQKIVENEYITIKNIKGRF